MNVGLTGFQGGSGGFIGNWLSDELDAAGHEVTELTSDVTSRWSFILRGRGGELLERTGPMMLDGVDVVVHLAARVGRLLCDDDPRGVIDTNAWGTFQVAEACRLTGTPLLYVSSSEAAYAGNLYGLTKRWGEEAAQLVFAGAEQQLSTARLFMPYGEGLPPGFGRAALVNWIDQAMNGQVLTVHADTSRSWCYVADTVRALRMILEHWIVGAHHRPLWNVGRTDNVEPSYDTARRAVHLFGRPAATIRVVPRPDGVVDHKLPDVGLIRDLGWRPTVDLEEGMTRVHGWLVDRQVRSA